MILEALQNPASSGLNPSTDQHDIILASLVRLLDLLSQGR